MHSIAARELPADAENPDRPARPDTCYRRPVKLYSFDGVDASLDLLPLAARRAVVQSGSGPVVDVAQVEAVLAAAPVTRIERSPDPDMSAVPAELITALGSARPVSHALWNALSPLDRFALVKVAGRGQPDRLDAAYAEIVGHSALSTHLAPAGGARMVDVAQKTASLRQAVAESRVSMSGEAFARVKTATVPKGDVLATARLAGIMGGKRTA